MCDWVPRMVVITRWGVCWECPSRDPTQIFKQDSYRPEECDWPGCHAASKANRSSVDGCTVCDAFWTTTVNTWCLPVWEQIEIWSWRFPYSRGVEETSHREAEQHARGLCRRWPIPWPYLCCQASYPPSRRHSLQRKTQAHSPLRQRSCKATPQRTARFWDHQRVHMHHPLLLSKRKMGRYDFA